MISARDVFYKMKVSELEHIVKIFELKGACRKKEILINIIYEYMKNNMSCILREFIVYDELNLLRKICDNNFKITYEDAILDFESLKSLLYIGLLYIDKENANIVIPKEFQKSIKSCLDDNCIIEFSKNRAEIINMVRSLLELYGVFYLELLEDYIINKIDIGYRVHKTIEFLRKYNMRNNFYYEDEDRFYYNLKITDRASMKMRILKTKLRYKYYNESEMNDIINRESHYEKDVKIILNRVSKNLKTSEEIVKIIRFMVIEGRSSDEICIFLKEKMKRLSNFGLRSIVQSVENMRNNYIIWGLKGYYLEEIDEGLIS